MAMVRLNVPSIFLYGGSILPGSFRGRQITDPGRVRGRRHAFGRQHDRRRTARRARTGSLSLRPAPAARSSPPTRWRPLLKPSDWLCLIPAAPQAAYDMRDKFCYAAGEKVMELHRQARSGRVISSPARRSKMPQRRCFGVPVGRPMPRCTCRRIAHEIGIEFDLFDVARIFEKHPLHRRSETGRQICRQGHVRGRRHSGTDEDHAGAWLSCTATA
jgi:dihydroxy-acid dehydratase